MTLVYIVFWNEVYLTIFIPPDVFCYGVCVFFVLMIAYLYYKARRLSFPFWKLMKLQLETNLTYVKFKQEL